jgi:hypothetical protein
MEPSGNPDLNGDESMAMVGRTARRIIKKMPILRTMVIPLEQWRREGKATKRGFDTDFDFVAPSATIGLTPQPRSNSLREFFDRNTQGPGIWKWNHYFDIYDRHFRQFRGQEVHVLEIGVYSGGSLNMWHDYFGPKAIIYGVDIEPNCRVYENDGIKIFIGDQADRSFWCGFRQIVPTLDIVIDDGGHQPEQQIVSVEELLPFLRPGGVYVCEDVHGAYNQFASYVHGLGHKLNDSSQYGGSDDNDRRLFCGCTPFQSAVGSIHLYPFVTVLERNVVPVAELICPKHGTQWQPEDHEKRGDYRRGRPSKPTSPVIFPQQPYSGGDVASVALVEKSNAT